MYYPTPFTSESTSYGSRNEPAAKNKYLQRFPERHIHNCGVLLQPRLPFLGATPDGIVCDSKNHDIGLLEVKCPFTARDMTVKEAALSLKNFYVVETNDSLTISKSHNCYYQIQGQLLLSGLEFCDFVLNTTKDMFIERVYRDSGFINQIVDKLFTFQKKYYLSEI